MTNNNTEQIMILDLTQGDEPVITYRDVERRQPLANIDITRERTRGRRRGRQLEEPSDSDNEENIDPSRRNRLQGRRVRRRNREQQVENPEALNLQEGIGLKSNPWIQHIKAFAKSHGISYWKALKSPQCKSSYK